MPNQPGNDSLAAVVYAAMADNPVLQSRAERLASKIMDSMEFTLIFGSQGDKASLQKAVLPTMMRSLVKVKDAELATEEKEAFDRIMGVVRGDDA